MFCVDHSQFGLRRPEEQGSECEPRQAAGRRNPKEHAISSDVSALDGSQMSVCAAEPKWR